VPKHGSVLAQEFPGHGPQNAPAAHRHDVKILESNAPASVAVVRVNGRLEEALDLYTRLKGLDGSVAAQRNPRNEIAGCDSAATEGAKRFHEVIEEPSYLVG
jgi:hypothetical protein